MKIKLQKCENAKRKLNNMEQVQMGYWEMDIEKVNKFNFLNEKVEEFKSSWSQSLVSVKSHLKPKSFEYCLWGINIIFNFSFKHSDVLLLWVKYMVTRGRSRDFEKGVLNVGHHGWPMKQILGFRWSKKSKITLETKAFGETFLSVFSNFLHFYT